MNSELYPEEDWELEIDFDRVYEDANDAIAKMNSSHLYYTKSGILVDQPWLSDEEALNIATKRQADITNDLRRTVTKYQIALYSSPSCREYLFNFIFNSYEMGDALSRYHSKYNTAVKGLNPELSEELYKRLIKAREYFTHRKPKQGIKELLLASINSSVYYSPEMLEVLCSAAEDGDPHASKAVMYTEEIKSIQEKMLSICYASLVKLTSERIHGLLIAKGLNSRQNSSVQFCDLFQHLCEEVLKATFRYDRKGFAKQEGRKAAAWSNYAYSVASHQINYFINENTRLVSIDRAIMLRSNVIREAAAFKGVDSYKKIAEVANKILIRNKGKVLSKKEEFTPEEVEKLLMYTGSGNPISLDAVTQGEDDDNKDSSFGESFGDESVDTEDFYDMKNVIEKIRQKLRSCMNEEEWEVISLRYHLNTDEAILGMTKMAQDRVVYAFSRKFPNKKMHKNKVKMIEDRVIARIRERLNTDKEWHELLKASMQLEENPIFRNRIGVINLSKIIKNYERFYLTEENYDIHSS